jgi:hypothetical protein
MKQCIIGLVGLTGLLGCDRVAEPESQERLGSASAAVTASGLPEYRDTADRSRLAIGPGAVSRTEFGYVKVVGTWATHALNSANGLALGVAHAGAPTLARPPFGASLGEHNDHVQSMFVAAGIPAAEIGSVVGGVSGVGGGSITETPDLSFANPTRRYSRLIRVANGIVIADSFAWAEINEDDDVVQEGVYWPAIPQQVIDEATALQATLETPGALGAFTATLPSGSGRVAIRHSSAYVAGSFEAYAVYDITMQTGMGHVETLHFNANGQEIRLPQERRTLPATAKPPQP